MNLFDAARPRLGGGVPSLRDEDSAIPSFSVTFLSETHVLLGALLRNYSSRERAYSYRYATVKRAAIADFFIDFYNDPEATLRIHFSWTAQAQASPVAQPAQPTSDMTEFL